MVSVRESIEQIERLRESVDRMNKLLNNTQLQNSFNEATNNVLRLHSAINKNVEVLSRNYESATTSIAQRMQRSHDALLNTLKRIPLAVEMNLDYSQRIMEKLNETTKSIEPYLNEDDRQEFQQITNNYYITINETKSESSKVAFWMNVFAIVSFLVTFIYQFQRDIQSDIENERNKIIQQQQFDEMINKFNELIEVVRPEIPELPSSDQVQDQHTSE